MTRSNSNPRPLLPRNSSTCNDLNIHITISTNTRHSIFCSQPEQDQHWPTHISGEGKVHGLTGTRTIDLTYPYHGMTLPTELQRRKLKQWKSPRFFKLNLPTNLLGTMPEISFWSLQPWRRTHTNLTGVDKADCPNGTKTEGFSHTMGALCQLSIEPHGLPLTIPSWSSKYYHIYWPLKKKKKKKKRKKKKKKKKNRLKIDAHKVYERKCVPNEASTVWILFFPDWINK